jgi:hypothetical protein
MRLVPEWKKLWRAFSVQAMALAAAIQASWAMIPDDMKASIPVDWVSYGTMALLVLGLFGRVVDQT